MVEKTDNQDTARGNELVNTLLSNKVMKVDRKEFLYKLFKDEVQYNDIIQNGPVNIIDEKQIESIAMRLIDETTLKSSTASFVAGLPGGAAAFATIPADILQFYGMSINLAQKLMYLYGYPDMYNDDKLTEEGRGALIVFLGVMLGVSGANTAVKGISTALAGQAMKKLPQKALTKTVYYPIIKKTLANLGVKVTKNSFAKSVSKVIPVVGGVVSGGLTMVTIKPMGKKLKSALHEGTYLEVEVVVNISEGDSTVVTENTPFDKLKQAKELFDLGIIDESEFTKLKNQYMLEL